MTQEELFTRVLLASMQDELQKIAASPKGLMGVVHALDQRVISAGRHLRRGRIAIKRAPPKKDIVLRKGRSDPKWLQGDKRRAVRNMIDRLLGAGTPAAGVAAVGAGTYYGRKAYQRRQNENK